MYQFYRWAAASVLCSGLSFSSQAQVVTDPARALAARDSVQQQATAIRQELEGLTLNFVVRAPRSGKRRIITRGYGPRQPVQGATAAAAAPRVGRRTLLWRKVEVRRRSGTTVEKFRGYSYLGRQPVLQETRHNGRLTYLVATRYKLIPFVSKPAVTSRGVLTGTGFVRWGKFQYIVPSGS
jgi:hypothetical protein